MKIMQPISEENMASFRPQRSYRMLYAQINAMPEGQWLPVICDTPIEAGRLYNSARQLGFSVRKMKLTIYLQRKRQTELPGEKEKS